MSALSKNSNYKYIGNTYTDDLLFLVVSLNTWLNKSIFQEFAKANHAIAKELLILLVSDIDQIDQMTYF